MLHPLSTSNHNTTFVMLTQILVVLHPLSTSNHNSCDAHVQHVLLYCILFLHQTTTITTRFLLRRPLYCILFLHQTTTDCSLKYNLQCCIASSFYIKPQRSPLQYNGLQSCIASSFYIKPQPMVRHQATRTVVLHPLSTSNHNCMRSCLSMHRLYCILFLHQTTTDIRQWLLLKRCIASSFYIKPQRFCPTR